MKFVLFSFFPLISLTFEIEQRSYECFIINLPELPRGIWFLYFSITFVYFDYNVKWCLKHCTFLHHITNNFIISAFKLSFHGFTVFISNCLLLYFKANSNFIMCQFTGQ
jgi:hypothetical protein